MGYFAGMFGELEAHSASRQVAFASSTLFFLQIF